MKIVKLASKWKQTQLKPHPVVLAFCEPKRGSWHLLSTSPHSRKTSYSPPLHIDGALAYSLISMSHSHLGTAQACQCQGCTRLVMIRDGLVDCLATLDYEQQDLDIAVRVFDELDALHTSIGLRHAAAARRAAQNGEGRGEQPGDGNHIVSARPGHGIYERG